MTGHCIISCGQPGTVAQKVEASVSKTEWFGFESRLSHMEIKIEMTVPDDHTIAFGILLEIGEIIEKVTDSYHITLEGKNVT